LRAAPPDVPECWSVAPVSSFRRKPCSPRSPAAQAGRSRETQTVSETTTMSQDQFAKFLSSEIKRWAQVTKTSGAKLD